MFAGIATGVLAVVAVILGWLVWSGQKPAPEAMAPEPVAAVAPEPEPAPVEPAAVPDATAEPAVEVAADPAPAEAPDLAETQFDLLRGAPDGGLVVAGTAEPGALVEVMLNGAKIGEVRATERGEYSILLEAGASADDRLLTLRVTGADGVAREGAESLVVEAGGTSGKVLVAGADGVRVLAAAAETLVIDTLSNLAGAGQVIAGRGAPAGAVLRAYLDNAEVGLAAPDAEGAWQIELPAFGAGAHLLRVDALDAAGKVIARAETEVEGVAAEPDVAPEAMPVPLSAMAEDRLAARAEAEAQGLQAVTGAGSGATRPALDASAEPTVESTVEAAPDSAEAAPATMAEPGADPERAALRRVTISEGNTLWAIAREAYGDGFFYVRVFEANRDQIRDPDLIYPGQVFTLPQ
ncbi:hypothetical protein CLN94_05630 [Pseudothioclava arenosa]|uniref:LysM domain-containing protein n=2 Tax=Pseudothioclava arenosa TaxID=1795308 RepID=A0A2A4CSC6_9RHOB|nr:hypothetical protein CLN94_05630 [Pseudothioclava arenosa]